MSWSRSPKRVFSRHRTTSVSVAALAILALVAGLLPVAGSAQARRPDSAFGWVEPLRLDSNTAERLFTSYDVGRYAEFDRLASTLASSVVNPFEFEVEAERWMDGATDAGRRAFVAAAVALELASMQARREQLAATSDRPALERHFTRNQLSFVLAELGCAWLRDHPASAAEQAWHAAYVTLARATGSEGRVVPIEDFRLRWIEPARISMFGPVVSGILRERDTRSREREREDRTRSVYRPLMEEIRRRAAHVSRSTRIEMSEWQQEHGRHLLARFPEDPHPAFLEATLRESWRARAADTLLFESVWLGADEVQRAASGLRAVRAIPPNRRMDRASADRLFRVLPEPEESLFLPTLTAQVSAAFTSLMLWDIADGFQAVADREPVAAEASLRLGQTYARLARPDLALPAFARAESLGTTPYELYLARLFAGAVFTRTGHRAEAITAFRGALQAVPGAPSASFALGPLLLQMDAREEAAEIMQATMRLPQAADPLHAYYTGDPTALSRAVARLRQEATR